MQKLSIKNTLFLLVTIFSWSVSTYAQVSIENLRTDESKGFHNQIDFKLGLQAGNTNENALKSYVRTDYISDELNSFVIVDYKKAAHDGVIFAEKGFLHLRAGIPINETQTIEYFVQKEFNEFIAIQDRTLFGASLRISPYNSISKETGAGFQYYFGIGGMYENEIMTAGIAETRLFRSTNYLSCIWYPKKHIGISSVVYYQPNIQNFNDFRILATGEIEVSVVENISLVIDAKFRFDKDPPVGIGGYDLEVNNGLKIRF
jgi:hypothetical protein